MSRYIETTFVPGPELGERLRGLRRRAGLSIAELAHLMGRKPGYHQHIGLLENGRLKHPSVSLLADYLRACRASFSDILSLLDRYTNQPAVRESRARETALSGLAGDESWEAGRLDVYDRKTETARKRAGQQPVPARTRAKALARQLAARKRYQALDRVVLAEVDRLGIRPGLLVRQAALDYGRMVWKALEVTEPGRRLNHRDTETGRVWCGQGAERTIDTKTRRKIEGFGQPAKRGRGRPRKTRAERLRDAEARFRAQAGSTLSAKALRQIAGRVIQEHLARTDE